MAVIGARCLTSGCGQGAALQSFRGIVCRRVQVSGRWRSAALGAAERLTRSADMAQPRSPMMRSAASALPVLCLLGLSIRAQELCDPTAGRVREVAAVAKGIVDADNAQDLARVMRLYTEDAVLMPPGEDAVAGKANIRPRYEQLFASFRPRIENHVEETCVSGSLAFVRGRTAGKLLPKEAGQPRMLDDSYLMLLRQDRDGAWRISHLMWHPRGK